MSTRWTCPREPTVSRCVAGRLWAARRKWFPSSAWYGATWPGQAGPSTNATAPYAAFPFQPGWSKARSFPSPSSPPPPRPKAATTRTSPSSRWPRSWGATCRRSCAAAAWPSSNAAASTPGSGVSSLPIRSSSSGKSTARSSSLTRCSRPTAPGSGRPMRTSRAVANRRSTSNSFATGFLPPIGTRTARHPPCPTTSCRRRARSTSKRTSGSRGAS